MMCAIVIGCSGAIAMSLIIRKKQVEKQRRQQVVVITVHKFSYFSCGISCICQGFQNMVCACLKGLCHGSPVHFV